MHCDDGQNTIRDEVIKTKNRPYELRVKIKTEFRNIAPSQRKHSSRMQLDMGLQGLSLAAICEVSKNYDNRKKYTYCLCIRLWLYKYIFSNHHALVKICTVLHTISYVLITYDFHV